MQNLRRRRRSAYLTTQSSGTPGLLDAGLLTVQTLTSGLKLQNVHDLLYENIYFQGHGYSAYGTDNAGLIYIGGNVGSSAAYAYNITFRNCRFGECSEAYNGVKIMDLGGAASPAIHDILFDHCLFDYQPRMSFECNGRSNSDEGDYGATNGYGFQRVDVTNCVFSPAAGENISYDDNQAEWATKRAGNCLVQNNILQGAGELPGKRTYAYPLTFEINGVHNMTVLDNVFGCSDYAIANLGQRSDDISRNPTNNPMNWDFQRNVWDGSYNPGGFACDNQVFLMARIQQGGAVFSDRIIKGSYSSTWAWADPVCNNMDFTDTEAVGFGSVGSRLNPGGNTGTGNVWPLSVAS